MEAVRGASDTSFDLLILDEKATEGCRNRMSCDVATILLCGVRYAFREQIDS